MKQSNLTPNAHRHSTLRSILVMGVASALLAVLASRVAGFAALAPLISARTQHTATLLPNGKVLIVGGSQAGFMTSMSTAEIYDPVSNTTVAAASMVGERRNHTATLLPDGRVLVAGGFVGMLSYAVGTAEIYDPASNTWTAAGSLATPRGNHSAILMINGRVLVAGGAASDLTTDPTNASALGSAEVYDPATNTWTEAGKLAQERYHHSATVVSGGRVLVTGGVTLGGAVTASAEFYDPIVNAWFSLSPMKTARSHHTATMLTDGKVLAAGGWVSGVIFLNTVEMYDPNTNTWDDGPSLGSTRAMHTATLLNNGRVLVTGGTNGAPLKCSELYDPASKMWMIAGDLLFVRWEHSATLLPDGKVFLAGGSSENATTELYDEAANQAPGILSAPSVAPNPATSGAPATFVVVAADPDGDALTYTWDFGDGSFSTSAATTSHTYAAGGMYTAKVSISDGVNPPVSDSVVVTVVQALNLTITKASVKLNFSRIDADSISIAGVLEVPAMFTSLNSTIAIDVGGVKHSMMLNTKATAANPYDSIKIALPKRLNGLLPTPAKFSATFRKGNFSFPLATSGLINADIARSNVTVPFRITLNGAVMNASKALTYKGKFRKWGAAQ